MLKTVSAAVGCNGRLHISCCDSSCCPQRNFLKETLKIFEQIMTKPQYVVVLSFCSTKQQKRGLAPEGALAYTKNNEVGQSVSKRSKVERKEEEEHGFFRNLQP